MGQGAWWSGDGAALLGSIDAEIIAHLSHQAARHYRINEQAQLRAWVEQLRILRRVCHALPDPAAVTLLLEFEIPRLGGRIDAVMLLDRAVLVLEFKGADRFEPDDAIQLEAYALDLQDYHAGSRRHPILPILVATRATTPLTTTIPMMWPEMAPVMQATAESLAGLIATLFRQPDLGGPPLDRVRWQYTAYRPVPNVIEAACRLFRRHDVAEIMQARADATNLSLTTDRIAALVRTHREAATRLIVFVTGIPGAGKTLCGLNIAFAAQAETQAAFLTGNPSLVHVLREALVRSVASSAAGRRAARHRVQGVIQALPRFRDGGVAAGDAPAERLVVIDEAQRCWTEAYAIAKTRDRPVRLDRSEPAHLLDIMTRHAGFAAIVCLVGQGQEIHDGEGGLAAWSEALASRPEWHVAAAGTVLRADEPRNRMAPSPRLTLEPSLHLEVAVRALRHDATPHWVDCVLRGDSTGARAVVAAHGPVPFRLTRDLAALRAGLRARARNTHRAGLVASAGARRLRAEGLGVELPHMDADAVARWFLDSWTRDRDVRASDALETVATQFSVQGLELDHVGLCWDGDLIRDPSGLGWSVRSFRGTRWQVARDPDKIAWRLNTYRVLLTRARFETLIWVPRGDPDDPSRDPAVLDRVASFLSACGATPLRPAAATAPGSAPDGLFAAAAG